MSKIKDQIRNQINPFAYMQTGERPRTFSNFVRAAHTAFDPAGGATGDAIAHYSNTNQNNLRGTMDPGQVFGPNANPIPGPDPNAPGSVFNIQKPGGTPYQPSRQPGQATNGLAGGTQSGGIDWAQIIARALRK
jgi:hypothetical protein